MLLLLPVSAAKPCDAKPCARGVCIDTGDATAPGYNCDCTNTGYTGPTCDETVVVVGECISWVKKIFLNLCWLMVPPANVGQDVPGQL